MKNVEDNRRIDSLRLLRQPFECQLWRTPFSSGVRIVFREVLFHELDKSLFGKSSLPCSVRLFFYGPHHRKSSSWDSSSTLEYTSETVERRPESLPRRMGGNIAKQFNFLPRKPFQPAHDDILSDCVTGCPGAPDSERFLIWRCRIVWFPSVRSVITIIFLRSSSHTFELRTCCWNQGKSNPPTLPN